MEMALGFVGLPVSIFLYWVILRSKKEAPFPKGGLLRLALAGAISVAGSTLLTLPITGVIAVLRTGALSDFGGWLQTINTDPGAFQAMLDSTSDGGTMDFAWSLLGMFLDAGLLEEGLKFLTCRIATKKEGMIHTWMDSVVAFAFVGITFELIENIAFGTSEDLTIAIIRALAPAHFVFGVIMGYFYGKYLVTKKKRYAFLSLMIPVIYHTVTNALVSLPYISYATVISHGVAAVVAVILILRWQKNKTLDIPVDGASQPRYAPASSAAATPANASAVGGTQQPKHAQGAHMKTEVSRKYTTYPRQFVTYKWFKPLLVALIFAVLYVLSAFLITFLTRVLFGTTVSSQGYDDMDFYSAAGAFSNGAGAAVYIPCILLAALIVRDRPISSYFSCMGGWRWKSFLKSLLAAFIIIGIPTAAWYFTRGRVSDIRFTLGGFILLSLFIPLQGIGEELIYRGYFMQTVASWFMLPVVGVLAQTLIFSVVHPYNIVGITEIAVSALLYALACILSRGLEAPSAMHIANNVSEIFMAGFGFGIITAEQTVPDVALNLALKVVFCLFILYASKKLHWFDELKYDDVEAFNAKRQ